MLRRCLVGCLGAVFVGGCGPAGATTTTTTAALSATPTATAAPTPPPSGPPHISVVSSGAAPTANATSGVAVVHNDDAGRAAVSVTVTFTATSSNGKAPVTVATQLAGLSPDETQAVTAALPIPSDDNVAAVSATVVSNGSGVYINFLTPGKPRFDTSAFEPSIVVDVTNSGKNPVTAITVAVCFDGNGHLTGGGQSAPIQLAGGDTKNQRFGTGVTDTPDHCDAYAHPV